MKGYRIAVVGVTGAVGQEMLNMLAGRKFPVEDLYPFASARSVGKTVSFNGAEHPVIELNAANVDRYAPNIDAALFSAGASVSREYAPLFARHGVFVIDNSSAWRMDDACPLVVPEVNAHALTADRKIIANPNCSTIQMVVVLNPLHRAAGIRRIVVSTYQSVSGAGGRAMLELREETGRVLQRLAALPSLITDSNDSFTVAAAPGKVFPRQIAFNLIPQIDVFTENGYTKEEMKMVNETRKIMEIPGVRVSAQCVRAPVFRAHSESVWIETERALSAGEARRLLSHAENVVVVDDPENTDAVKRYPTPLDGSNRQVTFVGRIREDISCDNGLVMWIVSDNLLKGAALNAVQILEVLAHKEMLA
jgi:aspartate-semialdehyde dehydrogenase